jgi:pyruvate dehydrogenase E2 component (dihydrolipoamide acetyltransferase)
MPFTVTMPKLSPTMEEGTIIKWHKKPNDAVRSGELLLDVGTDKATIEYQALDGGYLRQILVKEGSMAQVGQAIAVFTVSPNESLEGFQIEPVPLTPPQEKPAVACPVPSKPQQAASPSSAILESPAFAPEPPLQQYSFAFPKEAGAGRIAASPLAKKLALERGLDLTTVKGSGPKGRVVSRDLAMAQPDRRTAFGRRETPDTIPGTYEEVPLTQIRKVIGQRLQQAKTFIPHFYIRQEIDAEPLTKIRSQMKNYQIEATINDFIIRAAALSLREHPMVNSGFHATHQSIILFKTVDIAVAVSVEGGLITPIIRHADYKNLGEISVEMKQLARKARENALETHEYKGGSFTITNLGMYQVTEFISIINPPQSSILAVGGIEDCVRIQPNAMPSAGKKMNLTLSCDHRVVDGAIAAQFIKCLQKYLENPAVLL